MPVGGPGFPARRGRFSTASTTTGASAVGVYGSDPGDGEAMVAAEDWEWETLSWKACVIAPAHRKG